MKKKKRASKPWRKYAIQRAGPYLRRVGEIASLWSQLEFDLDFIVWELLHTEQKYSACVTAQLGFHQKLKALKAVVAVRDQEEQHQELLTTLNKFGGDATSAYGLRNRAVHDAWGITVGSGSVSQQNAAMKGSRLLFGTTPTTIKDLEKTISQIRALLKRADRLKDDILGALAPSPYKYELLHFVRKAPKARRPGRRNSSPEKPADPPQASSA